MRKLREKKIGAYTVYEGTNSRWNGISGPAHSATFERMVRGKATTEEYVDEIRQRVRDARKAHALLGRRVWRRWPVSSHRPTEGDGKRNT